LRLIVGETLTQDQLIKKIEESQWANTHGQDWAIN
jgi:hypothetical protein